MDNFRTAGNNPVERAQNALAVQRARAVTAARQQQLLASIAQALPIVNIVAVPVLRRGLALPHPRPVNQDRDVVAIVVDELQGGRPHRPLAGHMAVAHPRPAPALHHHNDHIHFARSRRLG